MLAVLRGTHAAEMVSLGFERENVDFNPQASPSPSRSPNNFILQETYELVEESNRVLQAAVRCPTAIASRNSSNSERLPCL